MEKICCMIIVAAAVIIPVGAKSQECTDLARVISRESEKFSDKNQVDILNTANLCSSEYQNATSEQRAQIEAAYGLFSGGASGSSSQIQIMQKARCENRYGSEWRDRLTSNEIQRVSQAGADVVRACLDNKSFRLVGLKMQDDAVAAAFRYGGPGDIIINGVIVSPPDVAQCKFLYNGKSQNDLSKMPGVQIKSGETVTMDCIRKSQRIADGRNIYRGGIIGVATTAELAQLPLISYSIPAVSETTADSLTQQINDLKKEIAAEKSEAKTYADRALQGLSAKLAKSGTDSVPSPGGNQQSALCPVGTFMVATRYQIDPGGGHGITSWLFPVCRTLQP